MRRLSYMIVLLEVTSFAFAQESKIHELLQRAKVGATEVNALSVDDIPDEWKVRKSVAETTGGTTVSYSRNGSKLLDVYWASSWRDQFACTLFAEGKKVGTIIRVLGKTTVFPSDDTGGIKLYTSLRDDGLLEVAMLRADATVVDLVTVKGRESHLLDDLEYTKGMLLQEMAIAPLAEAALRIGEDVRRNSAKSQKPLKEQEL